MKEHVSKNLDVVGHLHDLVREHPDFEVLCEPGCDGYRLRYVPNGLADRQREPKVLGLIDCLNEVIAENVRREGFSAVTMIRFDARVAISVSISPHKTSTEDIDAMFEAIARCGRLLEGKLSVRYEMTADMETRLCLNESHSSPTEVSLT